MRSSMKLLLGLSATLAPLAACDLAKQANDAAGGNLGVPDTAIVQKTVQDGLASFKYTSTIPGSTFKCNDGSQQQQQQTQAKGAQDQVGQDDWFDCAAEGHQIALLDDATTQTFKVKAVSPTGAEDPTPAEATFGASDAQALTVQGANELTAARSGSQILVFADGAAVGYECLLDGVAQSCVDGRLQIDLDTLAEGSHTLNLAALYADGLRREATVNFCAKACTLAGNPAGGNALANTLQIGDFYTFDVGPGYHVTEYSTSKTTGPLSFYRILPQADQYYLGNYKCASDWDSMVSSMSPDGQALDYCHSTPTREAFKDTHEFRLANNHVEIATDGAKVSDDNHERISVSIYDTDWEFMTSRSRFKNLCRNSDVSVRRLPMVNDFFYGRLPEEVNFWYCDVIIPGRNGSPEVWKAGAFIDIDQLDWNCADCIYPRAVEVIYMSRPNQWTSRPDYFAKQAQERILKHLAKLTP